jgi:autotransporter-associated beta strand protein
MTYIRCIIALLAIGLGPVSSFAQDATWGGGNAPSNDWSNPFNWNPIAPSFGPTGIATFTNTVANCSPACTNVTNSADVNINTVNFTANALAYTFNLNSNGNNFQLNGAGIVNNSNNTQTFIIPVDTGMFFNNSATVVGRTTIINNGAISVNNSANFGSATVITNNGGSVSYASTGSSAQAQVITNLGGVFDMSAAPSGVALGSIAGGGLYILGNNALTVGSNNLSTTVSGVITEASFVGSLVKTGSGTLTLDGANTYTGGTTVSGGTLIVGDASTPGASISGNATVNPGGTLGGYGTILGSLANNGIARPGGSIGTLTVNGNYTQGPGGTLTIELSPTAASQLRVGGAATLAGTLQLVFDTGVYSSGTLYKILTASSVNGQFANVSGISPSLQTLFYDPNDVTLSIAATLPSYLQFVCLGALGQIASSCGVTPTEAALTAIERSLMASTTGEIRSQTNVVIDQIMAREWWVIRDLAALGDLPDAMPGDTMTLDEFSSNEPLRPQYRGLSAGSPDARWGIWVDGSGSFLGNNTSTGYSGSSEVGLAGLDFLANRQWLLGFTAGYTHADLTLTPIGVPRLSRQVDGGLVGPYAAYIINPHMAMDALFNYTSLGNSISAPTPLPSGGYHSNRVTGAAHLDIFANYNALKLTGFGGYAYTWEGGPTSSVLGPGFGLANNVRYGAIRLGGEVSYHLGNFEPYLPLRFEYETTKPNDGTSRAAIVVGGGLRYRWNDTLAGELLAETTELKTHTRDVLISAHLRQSF